MASDQDRDAVEIRGAQALMRALDIMDQVLEGPIRAVDLARKLDLSKTTAHRIAQALKSRGYLSVTSEGFGLGPKLLQLGVMATEQIDYVRVARPFMEKLSEETGFCVFIGKREGDWSRHLDRVAGRQRLRVATAPGDRRPIAQTGLGKALLLDDDEAAWAQLYRTANGHDVPDEDLTNYIALMRADRVRGTVLHESEVGDGVRSIAAPIRDARGQICVAVSIASAAHYLTDDVLADLVKPILETAEQISDAVGYRPRRDAGAKT